MDKPIPGELCYLLYNGLLNIPVGSEELLATHNLAIINSNSQTTLFPMRTLLGSAGAGPSVGHGAQIPPPAPASAPPVYTLSPLAGPLRVLCGR